jgi:alpha-glucosidase
MTMWNSDFPGYAADTDPLYQSIPFFLGVREGRAYGIYFDNSYRSSFDMGKEDRSRYSFGAEGGELSYYFFAGPEPTAIVQRFTELVGRMPLPPLWSLGYQQCRWSYAPDARVREIARTFREKKIPADVIYLDIDYMEGYRIFTWSRQKFPDPRALVNDLAADGFKVAVIVDPGIKQDSTYHAYRTGLAGDHFLKRPDGSVYIGKVWPGECAFPDFSREATRRWWGDQFKELIDIGVRGWWTDMNEPSVFDVPVKTIDLDVIHFDDGFRTPHARNHNLYGLQMTQATYDGVRRLLPAERPFVLTRASFAGGQRYAAAWTGDNVASWEHLRMVIPMCLNLSISGQPFVGSDIGGFIDSPDGELYARWLQLGVFTPLMRTHTVINSADQEPWSYGPAFEEINRRTIELRYRLLPYLYTAMEKASRTGVPPMRPLFFDDVGNTHTLNTETEFFFGDAMLVAPVLKAGERRRSLRLPRGSWCDFRTGERLGGDTWITADAPLEQIPVFVKAGSIIPLQAVEQHVGAVPFPGLTLLIYPGESGDGSLYEDDGKSFDYESGSFLRREFRKRMDGNEIVLSLNPSGGTFRPARTTIDIEFLAQPAVPTSVRVNGKKLAQRVGRELPEGEDGWIFVPDLKIVRVRIRETTAPIEIRLTP